MVRIKATDNEGRYLEPFLSYLVMNMDQSTEILKRDWGAIFIDSTGYAVDGEPSYIQFEDPKMATAFTLRWSGAAQEAIDSDTSK